MLHILETKRNANKSVGMWGAYLHLRPPVSTAPFQASDTVSLLSELKGNLTNLSFLEAPSFPTDLLRLLFLYTHHPSCTSSPFLLPVHNFLCPAGDPLVNFFPSVLVPIKITKRYRLCEDISSLCDSYPLMCLIASPWFCFQDDKRFRCVTLDVNGCLHHRQSFGLDCCHLASFCFYLPPRNIRGFLTTDIHDAHTQTWSWYCKQASTKTSHPLIVTLMRNKFPVALQRQRSDGWRQLRMGLMCACGCLFGHGCECEMPICQLVVGL